MLFLLSMRLCSDYDLGFHLRTGQWIFQNGSAPTHDAYTYTVPDHEYVDTSWFYQLALYLLYRLGQYPLMTLVNSLAIFLSFLLIFFRMRLAGGPTYVYGLFLAIAILASEIRFQIRPEVLSWLLLNLTLLILDLWKAGRKNLLFLLPFIHLLWVNVHGLFCLGWAVLAVYLVGCGFKGGRFKELFKYAVLSAAATVINPYFFKSMAVPWELWQHLSSGNIFKQSIAEFQSPWAFSPDGINLFSPGFALNAYKVLCFLTPVLMLMTFNKRKVHEWLIVGVFFYLSAIAVHNLPFFVMVAPPVLCACLRDLKWKWFDLAGKVVFSKPAFSLVLTLFLLVMSLRVLTDAYYVSHRRVERTGWGLNGKQLPVKAVQFLCDHRLDGRILNALNSAGWLVWRSELRIFIDGQAEVMGEDFFREYRSSFNLGGLSQLTAKYWPDIIFFNPAITPSWMIQLQAMPDWRLIYVDETTLIYARQKYAPQIPTFDFKSLLSEYQVSARAEEALSILDFPTPAFISMWLEGCFEPQEYPNELLSMAIVAAGYEQFDVAEPLYLEFLRRTRGRYYEGFFEAGTMYFQCGQDSLARLCLTRVLQETPQDHEARQMLDQLGK